MPNQDSPPTPPSRTPPGAPPAPAIHLRAASLRYGGRVVFEALDLELPGGRTTCLLGPSGVGKTSLLRLIAGLAPGAQGGAQGQAAGEAAGDVVDEAGRPVAGRVAYLAQHDLLLPWLSVLGNVTLGYRLRGEPRGGAVEIRARALLARVGLARRAGDRPAQLSGQVEHVNVHSSGVPPSQGGRGTGVERQHRYAHHPPIRRPSWTPGPHTRAPHGQPDVWEGAYVM